jgi:protein gp37
LSEVPERTEKVPAAKKKTAGRLLDGREWNEMPELTTG